MLVAAAALFPGSALWHCLKTEGPFSGVYGWPTKPGMTSASPNRSCPHSGKGCCAWRKLLLATRGDGSFDFSIPGGDEAEVVYVDQTTGFQPPATTHLNSDQMTLRGLAVAVVTLPN